jgi:hypothetical protein
LPAAAFGVPNPTLRNYLACSVQSLTTREQVNGLAVKSPDYIKELAKHHVGSYLKNAPMHTEQAPFNKMMKRGVGSYDRFKTLFLIP